MLGPPAAYNPKTVTLLLACGLILASAATPAASPPPTGAAPPAPAAESPLPAEPIVLALREARIARISGDRVTERKILNRLIGTYPNDPAAIAGALQLRREDAPDSDATHALRSRLMEILARPGRVVPLNLLREMAGDLRSTPEELARLVDVLRAEPADAPDRPGRLRLLAALLERLGRKDEMIATLEQLVTVDADPRLTWRLLDAYRNQERWKDVLRLASTIERKGTAIPLAWYRMDALGALGRVDDLLAEAKAQIVRLSSSDAQDIFALQGSPLPFLKGAPPSKGSAGAVALDPRAAQAFYPTVFHLIDAGRRDAAKELMNRLFEATGGDPGVRRMRTMLFGTLDDRIALLNAEEMKTLASGDVGAIRDEADKRLVAKDYRAAYDLLERVARGSPKGFGDDVAGWFNFGLAAVQTAHWKEAEDAMSHVLALEPTMSRALAQRARARIMQKRVDEGVADAKAALALEPDSKQAAYAMYLAFQMRGETAEAQKWLKRSGAH